MDSTPPSRHHLTNWFKGEDPTICCLQENNLVGRKKHWLRVKGWKKIYQGNGNSKQAGASILISK
jgi:hypothetical protein